MASHLRLVSMTENPTGYVPKIEIVETTGSHIRELAKNIRQKDKEEIESLGFSCAKGLWFSYKRGLQNHTFLFDGKVAAVCGVGGTYLGPVGQPWLMTTTEVLKISPLRFARLYQKEIDNMLGLFPRLENYVLSSYDGAVRMLQIVGFHLDEPVQLGNGLYRKFSLSARP